MASIKFVRFVPTSCRSITFPRPFTTCSGSNSFRILNPRTFFVGALPASLMGNSRRHGTSTLPPPPFHFNKMIPQFGMELKEATEAKGGVGDVDQLVAREIARIDAEFQERSARLEANFEARLAQKTAEFEARLAQKTAE